ncbi:hypothetical protein Ccar_24560 [Clostridium carboxidivorans P7]|uniref:Uncharacterized protein n=1 Tax=Clostridium carboxidivorans P7 TaxID=536227 RepID=C6PU54_9CLOT|nr:hypothetical protein [Clostridium carboxidivorans]AKN33827.1 hypothetical protein Ccar_24560 [Clostridium carboxidivorans P7]EET87254.1 hypothetical protein CcarbDRAFT_2321 [Clostridium carboxidivorans P7]EFG86560.1 hypothetical protein CLCAR_3507 [Clostridium carboxidivorans P7]
MNNLNEDKELLEKIYSELESGKTLTEERKEELIQIIDSSEDRLNNDVTKKNTLIETKNKLKSIDIGKDEINIKKVILDSIKGVINLLTSFPWIQL